MCAERGPPNDHGPMIVLKRGRDPLRGARSGLIDENGDRQDSKQRIGVGLIGHLAFGGPHAPDHSAGKQRIGKQGGRMNRRSSDAPEIKKMPRWPCLSTCAAILRRSCARARGDLADSQVGDGGGRIEQAVPMLRSAACGLPATSNARADRA